MANFGITSQEQRTGNLGFAGNIQEAVNAQRNRAASARANAIQQLTNQAKLAEDARQANMRNAIQQQELQNQMARASMANALQQQEMRGTQSQRSMRNQLDRDRLDAEIAEAKREEERKIEEEREELRLKEAIKEKQKEFKKKINTLVDIGSRYPQSKAVQRQEMRLRASAGTDPDLNVYSVPRVHKETKAKKAPETKQFVTDKEARTIIAEPENYSEIVVREAQKLLYNKYRAMGYSPEQAKKAIEPRELNYERLL